MLERVERVLNLVGNLAGNTNSNVALLSLPSCDWSESMGRAWTDLLQDNGLGNVEPVTMIHADMGHSVIVLRRQLNSQGSTHTASTRSVISSEYILCVVGGPNSYDADANLREAIAYIKDPSTRWFQCNPVR